MKRNFIFLAICTLIIPTASFSQIYYSGEAQKIISNASQLAYEEGRYLPVYIKLQAGKEIEFINWQSWLSKTLKLLPSMGFSLLNIQKDQKNEIHYRYNQTYDGIPIYGNTFIVHTRNNKVYSLNGKIISSFDIGSSAGLSEQAALTFALNNINASVYKWQLPSEEALLKKTTDDANATYYPKGKLIYVPEKGNFKSKNYRLAYQFDIYASKPLKRVYVFVDAITGEIIMTLNRIHTTDTPGTAQTKYSGTQTIIADSYSGSYRLRESGRGNGIETYNMSTGTDYANAVDFTDADNLWNNVNVQQDEVATDAHWATEKTYDYYYNKFNRNSIDDNGFKLISYVHYDVDYVNAFWDGQCMTYGDGDITFSPLTTLDICGHEITHGLDEMTANLIYQDESGALNEGYSDIFGTCIEWYARPSNANWTMGEDIGSAFRDMSNPNAYGQPDTYLGTNWDPNQEVHQNAGVLAYWFYLTVHGGSGTNDNNDPYNVTGMPMDSAAAVAFRTLTIYLPEASTYADARFYSILAAIDLYGACTPKVEAVTNSWYAVGVGYPYSATITSNFSASFTSLCSIPATVHFTNQSTNANQFLWDFGDGATSSDLNPDHTYTAYGDYTVSLIAYAGNCGNDTLVKTSYISVSASNPCIVFMVENGAADTQTACNGQLFDSGGSGNYQDNTNSTITIAPTGAMNITLNFLSFSYELNYDYLYIYDGPDATSPLIGDFTGSSLPNGGTITSTTGSITLVQTSDQAVNESGFELNWNCNYPTAPPITNFKASDTSSCTGIIQFTDLSLNGPTSWSWDFGDGTFSTVQNPQHNYLLNGTYTVKLVNANSFGSDSLIKSAYIIVNKPADPVCISASRCDSGSIILLASGGVTLNWYNTPAGGNILYTGDTFITPVLGATTTYYVQNAIGQASQYVGPVDNTFGGGAYFTSNTYHYLKFNCYTPATLKSVKVFANSAGYRTIELTNSAGTLLMDTTVNIPSGQSRVTLDFDIPVGTGLRLGTAGQNNLWRNNSGASFPYTLPGLVSITGNSASDPGYYYYFYDWEVDKAGCSSNMVPVTAGILLPSAQVTPNGNITICNGQDVTLTSQVADSYWWSPGGQTTQSITVSTAGSYSVQITDDSCTANSLPVIVTITSNQPVAGFGYINNDPTVNFLDSSANATSYTWEFGDGGSSTLQNPVHTYTSNGTYTVTLIANNVCGSDTMSSLVTILLADISTYNSNNSITVFPNPSKGSFYLDIQTNIIKEINFRIYDVIGNTIKSGTLKPANKKGEIRIDMSNSSKGVYFLYLSNETLNAVKKIIIE
ncbi:MAG: PKD domain-containing protein [Bacteroidales bacterium]